MGRKIVWTKEKTIHDINEVYSKEGKITDLMLRNYNTSLAFACRKHFGSLENAMKESGIPTQKAYRNHIWSHEIIINKIVDIYVSGQSIRSGFIQHEPEYKALFRAARTYFGNWKTAVESAGFDYNMVSNYKVYSKDEIANLLRESCKEGKRINREDMDGSILCNAVREFGSIKKAIEYAGIDYKEWVSNNCSKANRFWTREKILDEILKYKDSGLPLHATGAENNNNGLYIAAIKEFGSWRKALSEVGFNDYLKLYSKETRIIGYKFEALLGDILKDLDIGTTKGKCSYSKQFRPDFVVSNTTKKIWIDAKLSEFTAARSNVKTISNYEPLCDELIIIYLIGDKEKNFQFSEKTRIVSVYEFIKEINPSILKNYEHIFDEILHDSLNGIKFG